MVENRVGMEQPTPTETGEAGSGVFAEVQAGARTAGEHLAAANADLERAHQLFQKAGGEFGQISTGFTEAAQILSEGNAKLAEIEQELEALRTEFIAKHPDSAV